MVKLQILDLGDDDVNFNYIITWYCKNEIGEDVVCHGKDFKPFFYVRLPINKGNIDTYDHIHEMKIIIKKALSDQITIDVKKIKAYREMDENDSEFQQKISNKMEY